MEPARAFGIQFPTAKAASLSKFLLGVTLLVFIMSILVISLSYSKLKVVQIAALSIITIVLGIYVSVLGAAGVRRVDRSIMGTFILTSLVFAIFQFVSYIVVMVKINYSASLYPSCKPDVIIKYRNSISETFCDDFAGVDTTQLYTAASFINILLIIFLLADCAVGALFIKELPESTPFAPKEMTAPRNGAAPIVDDKGVEYVVNKAQIPSNPAPRRGPPTRKSETPPKRAETPPRGERGDGSGTPKQGTPTRR